MTFAPAIVSLSNRWNLKNECRYVSGYEWGNIMMNGANRSSILPYVVVRIVQKGTWEHVLWNVIWWLLFRVCHLVLPVCDWGGNC